MGGDHCHTITEGNKRIGFVLWVSLVLNAIMFVVEIYFGTKADSLSLISDSLDFLSDSFAYGISIYAMSKSLSSRAKFSQLKAIIMLLLAAWIIGSGIYRFIQPVVPHYPTMGIVSFFALAVNIFCAYLLFSYRNAESNLKSVWLCSRNDAINNFCVIGAAFAVYYTSTGYPDFLVAIAIAALEVYSASIVFNAANKELKDARA